MAIAAVPLRVIGAGDADARISEQAKKSIANLKVVGKRGAGLVAGPPLGGVSQKVVGLSM